MRKLDVCDMEEFGRLESSEKTMAILGDRWWPQTAKQDGDKISKQFLCSIWKKRNERPNIEGVSIRSRNGAPSRKGCVVNGQITKASKKLAPPPPCPPIPCPPIPFRFVQALGTSYVNELDSERALRNLMAWVQHNPKYSGLEISVDEYSDGTLMDEVRYFIILF